MWPALILDFGLMKVWTSDLLMPLTTDFSYVSMKPCQITPTVDKIQAFVFCSQPSWLCSLCEITLSSFSLGSACQQVCDGLAQGFMLLRYHSTAGGLGFLQDLNACLVMMLSLTHNLAYWTCPLPMLICAACALGKHMLLRLMSWYIDQSKGT